MEAEILETWGVFYPDPKIANDARARDMLDQIDRLLAELVEQDAQIKAVAADFPPIQATPEEMRVQLVSLAAKLDQRAKENDRLRADNARLRTERNRLFEGAVGCYQRETFRDRPEMIQILLEGMGQDFLITGDVAAALAEHDRQAAKHER